jgi:hypothetical protein
MIAADIVGFVIKLKWVCRRREVEKIEENSCPACWAFSSKFRAFSIGDNAFAYHILF